MKPTFLLSILIFFSFSLEAADFYTTIATLNVRSGEGKQFPVSFTLQIGDEVKVVSKTSTWYQINYLGKTGYVDSKYLMFSRTTADTSSLLSISNSTVFQQRRVWVIIAVIIILGITITIFIIAQVRTKRLLERVTRWNRGERSERDLVLKLLKFGMPAHVIFHDLYVEKRDGNFSQIDLVAVTNAGIIVFEVKDYSGWLFGNGNSSHWTQVLAYGKRKYRFYNPIRQNNAHIAALRETLRPFGTLPFYSVVVFYGNCVLKQIDFIPSGTFIVQFYQVLDVVKKIMTENAFLEYSNEAELFNTLQQAVMNGSFKENRVRHKENVRNMLGKNRIFD